MIEKAGCILINKETRKIALIYRDYRNDYSFPKGHIEEGESLVECAIRETEEEIKRKVKLVSDDIFCIEEYVNQLLKFPSVAHDDFVDTISQYLLNYEYRYGGRIDTDNRYSMFAKAIRGF